MSHPQVRSFTADAYKTALNYRPPQTVESKLRRHDKLVIECMLLKQPISNSLLTVAASVHLTSLVMKATNR